MENLEAVLCWLGLSQISIALKLGARWHCTWGFPWPVGALDGPGLGEDSFCLWAASPLVDTRRFGAKKETCGRNEVNQLLLPKCGVLGEFDALWGSVALSSGLATGPVDGGSSSVLKGTTGGGSADDGRSSSTLSRTTGAGGRGGGPCFSDYETVTQMNKPAFWRSLITKGKAISVDRNGQYNTMLLEGALEARCAPARSPSAS